MSTRRARRRTVVAAVAAFVVALTALGASVAVMNRKPAAVDPIAVDKLTEIERLAPLGTSQLVLTPGVGQDNQWWKTVTAFMPGAVRLEDLTPTADLGITHLGYSFSAAAPAPGSDNRHVRMLYLQTTSSQHASAVQAWLATGQAAATGAFSTTIDGNTVVLAGADVALPDALPKRGAGLGSTVVFRQDTAEREEGSLLWEDWGAYVRAAGASGGKPAAYSKFFHAATGFSEGSRWAGYATSPQVGWSGRFQNGGMDPKLVSANAVNAAIQSFSAVLDRDSKGRPVASDAGAGGPLRGAFYAKHPDLKSPQAVMGSAELAFKPRAEGDTAFSFKPSYWLAGTTRDGAVSGEGLSLFAYSIHKDQINLKVTVDEAARKANAARPPVKTFAPIPGPPPGSREL